MRTTFLLLTAFLATGCFYPAHTRTEVGVVVPAPEARLVIYAYSSSLYGDWRTSYIGWTPVTIYYFSGSYYSTPVRGGRAIVVYSRDREYFFPPRDRGWVGIDNRFDYSRAPSWRDHGRAKQKGNGRRQGRP
jgi:hypothetical protein